MKKSKKLMGSIYAFLEASGVMEKGTEAEIAQAKKQYWANKKREWKNLRRKEHKCFELLFTKSENKLLQLNAKRIGISATRYIKQAALSTKCITPLELRGQVRQCLIVHIIRLIYSSTKHL